MSHRLALSYLALLASVGTSAASSAQECAVSHEAPSDTLDIRLIEQIVGREGSEQDGQYKITVPQNDLDLAVDGFRIIPPMGMGSWIAFTPAADGAVVMGDVVVKEEEIGPVQRVVLEHGLTVTGLHNHFVHEEPRIFFLRYWGVGRADKLAGGLRAALYWNGR